MRDTSAVVTVVTVGAVVECDSVEVSVVVLVTEVTLSKSRLDVVKDLDVVDSAGITGKLRLVIVSESRKSTHTQD